MKINLIVALDSEHGFSKDGAIPWINEPFAKEDLKHFRNLTMGNTCVMGRKTYEDIANFMGKVNILPGRDCVVLSRDPSYYISPEILVYDSMEHAIGTADTMKDIFIIGGGNIFEEAIKWELSSVYITRIDKNYECDKFFPYNELIKKYWTDGAWKSKEYPIIKYSKLIRRE